MHPPTVSIGLLAYNEERFIGKTIESLLAQDFTDFEVVVSDNCSTDRTPDICREYAARDPRLVYARNPRNVGSARNVNAAFSRARGKYFILACGHDLWDPTLLSKCVAVLESDPSVVLCYTDCAFIDEDDRVTVKLPRQVDTRGMSLRRRYNAVLWGLDCNAICGLHRTEAFRQALPMLPVIGPDSVVLSELSMLGAFANIPEPLFFLRVFRTCGQMPAIWQRMLNRETRWWHVPGLFRDFVRAFLAIVSRRAPTPSDRLYLGASTLLRLVRMIAGSLAMLFGSTVFPRTYARFTDWLVLSRRRRGPAAAPRDPAEESDTPGEPPA